MDVTTRIEEENRVVTPEAKPAELPSLSDIDSSDDDLEGLSSFNIETAKNDLYDLQGCHKIMLKTKVQRQLGVEVGINVSQEFPWKRIKFSLLSQHLFDEIDNGEMLQEFFVNYKPDDKVLLGYAPSVDQQKQDEDKTQTTKTILDEDPFVIYVTEDDACAAAGIVKNIETYERLMMHKKLNKRPRKWISKGSEYEVNLGVPLQKSEVADVEIQTVYPMKQSRIKFEMRLTSDVRDGYAELIAGDARFQNVTQQRVNVGTQSAPATVTLEQQTDPTFPSNAWSQYLYEIKEEQDGLDESSEEEEPEKGKSAATSKTVTPLTEVEKEPKPPPEVSDQIKYLLSVLEFNQIDMYRNDYPKISTAPIQIFTNPYLKEIFCFANISKSNKRYVSAVDWYPHMTGIVVAAYTFTTKVTQNSVQPKEKIDEVQRTILQPNPVLMWSFNDSLNFKLEFEAPREVTALSFCPYDKDILIGGTINGQIIIWDLQGRTRNLEKEEHLTVSEASNREIIGEFLSWTIPYDERAKIFPAAMSALEGSQTGPITDIKWLSRNHYISVNGKIHENPSKTKSRYFCTLSFNGSIAYWNLDYDIGSIGQAANKSNLPMALVQSESVYKKLDNCIKPVFMVTYPEAFTSIVCDEAKFIYVPQIDSESPDHDLEGEAFPVDVEEVNETSFRNTVIVGTFLGHIECLTFEGSEPGSEIYQENLTSSTYSFARVHDGPIIALKKNPFLPEIFVSIGRTVMAIWREDFNFTPILWRMRPMPLTAVEWSTDRPAVLYLTRNDGSFEAWDLLARDDDACLTEVLGGGIITALSEHRFAVPKKVISIGDYDSSFRMVALPESFYKPIPNELELLKNFVEKEINRKKSIREWQQNWSTQNADIIEEKRKSKAAAEKDLERLRLEAEEAKKLRKTPEDIMKEQTAPKSAAHYDFEEKLDKKWDELNLKRLIRNLMARKMVDPEKLDRETALEKERLRYEERKKASIKEALSKVSEEIAAIRARLLPVEKPDILLSETIEASVKKIIEISPSYADIELEAKTFLEETPPIPNISYDTIMDRCRERRKLLNKVLGVPFERALYCEQEKLSGFKDWDFGYDEFLRTLEESNKKSAKPSTESSLPKTSYSDLDLVPQKDVETQ